MPAKIFHLLDNLLCLVGYLLIPQPLEYGLQICKERGGRNHNNSFLSRIVDQIPCIIHNRAHFVDKNIIGYVDERGERGLFGTSKPISLTGTKGEKQRTSYYFWKNTGKIYEDKTGRDILVGAIERGRININPEYLGRRELAAIHGGVWRSGAIYREVLR